MAKFVEINRITHILCRLGETEEAICRTHKKVSKVYAMDNLSALLGKDDGEISHLSKDNLKVRLEKSSGGNKVLT